MSRPERAWSACAAAGSPGFVAVDVDGRGVCRSFFRVEDKMARRGKGERERRRGVMAGGGGVRRGGKGGVDFAMMVDDVNVGTV